MIAKNDIWAGGVWVRRAKLLIFGSRRGQWKMAPINEAMGTKMDFTPCISNSPSVPIF